MLRFGQSLKYKDPYQRAGPVRSLLVNVMPIVVCVATNDFVTKARSDDHPSLVILSL